MTTTPTRTSIAWKLREFVAVYRLYRQHNTRRYSARIAYGCAFQGLPF